MNFLCGNNHLFRRYYSYVADFLFIRLFMHRYRDIEPEIRMSCIRALGVWIVNYPSLFLQDSYLKYLGWTLNDKVIKCP